MNNSAPMLKRFELNTKGRDYVVGDIHGSFSKLKEALEKINFDQEVDRLFCCGDLVDRGPNSEDVYKWLEKPWFHSVRGNHDQMAIDAVRHGYRDLHLHLINGGQWLYGLPHVEQQCYAVVLEELPLAIEVLTSKGLVGIVHAEVPYSDWNELKVLLSSPIDESDFESLNKIQTMLWARNKIKMNDTKEIKGLYNLYVGHTVVDKPQQLGNVTYIDTGAVFGGPFSIIQIN